MDSYKVKVDKFIDRTTIDLSLLSEVASHQMRVKAEKEFIQSFGEMSVFEMIDVANYCKHRYVASLSEPDLLTAQPPTNLELPELAKKKAYKKKRRKKR